MGNIEIKKDLTSNWFKVLQESFCHRIMELEESKSQFKSTNWKRNSKKDEGGGEYRILKDGKIFDKVGVNFSKVYGKFPKKFQQNIAGAQKDPRFWASGISDVMHSKKDNKEKNDFHKTLRDMCNRHDKNYYKKYKKWCDEYFYLPHRKEPRGIGGIFFDYKKNNFEKNFKFVRDVGVTFESIFQKIISKK